jgi:hypothetical protein
MGPRRKTRQLSRPPVNEAPPRPELHPRPKTVPDEVSGPSDGKSRKRPRFSDDETPPPRLEPQLDPVFDDLPDDAHRQLDEATLRTLQQTLGTVKSFDDPFPPPFCLLVAIISNTGYQVDPQYENSSQLLLYLNQRPALTEMLEGAWKNGTFKQIRNLRVFVMVWMRFFSSRPKQLYFAKFLNRLQRSGQILNQSRWNRKGVSVCCISPVHF